MLNLNLPDDCKTILAIFDGIKYVEYLVSPVSNQTEVIRCLPYRGLTVTVKGEEVKLCFGVLLPVLLPRLRDAVTMVCVLPITLLLSGTVWNIEPDSSAATRMSVSIPNH